MERISRSMVRRFKLKQAVIRLRRIDEDDLMKQRSSPKKAVQQNQPSSEPLAQSELSGFPCKLCSRTFRSLPELYSHSYRLHRNVRLIRHQMRAHRAKCETSKIVTRPRISQTTSGMKLKQAVIHLQRVPENCLQIEPSSEASHGISNTETGDSKTVIVDDVHRAKRDFRLRLRPRKKLEYEQANPENRKLGNGNSENVISTSSKRRKKSKKPGRVRAPTLCMFCGKQFKESFRLVEHMVVHTKEKPYQCKMCNRSFSFKTSLIGHTKRAHTDKDVHCPNCQLRFPNKKTMEAHSEQDHGILLQKPPTVHSCGDCESVLPTAALLLKHSKTHGQVFNCKYCDGMFTKKCSLSLHVQSQHKDRRFHCTQCLRYIDFERIGPHMDYHKRKLASGTRVFKCKNCERLFDSARSLGAHFKEQHASELELKNSHSNKPTEPEASEPSIPSGNSPNEFITLDELQLQSNTLTSTEPQVPEMYNNFQCSICNKTFKWKSLLDFHIKLHTLKTGKHKCSVCELSFMYQTQLMRHQAVTHLNIDLPDATSNTCKMCGKAFPSSVRFLNHLFKQHVNNNNNDQSTPICNNHDDQRLQTSTHAQTLNSQMSVVSQEKSAEDSMDKRHTVIKEYKCDNVICHRGCTRISQDGVSQEAFKKYNEFLSRFKGQGDASPSQLPQCMVDAWNRLNKIRPQPEIHKEQPHVQQDRRNIPDPGPNPNSSQVLPRSNPIQVERQERTNTRHDSQLHVSDRSEASPRDGPAQFQRQAQQSNTAQLHVDSYRNQILRNSNLVQINRQPQTITQNYNTSHHQLPTYQSAVLRSSNPNTLQPQVVPQRVETTRYLNPVHVGHQTQLNTQTQPHQIPVRNEMPQRVNTLQIDHQTPTSSTYHYNYTMRQPQPYLNEFIRTANHVPIDHRTPTNATHQYNSPQQVQLDPYRTGVIQNTNQIQTEAQGQARSRDYNTSYSAIGPYRNEVPSIPNPVQIERREHTSIQYNNMPQLIQRTNTVLVQYQAPTGSQYTTNFPQILNPNQNVILLRTGNPTQIEHGAQAQIKFQNVYNSHSQLHTYPNGVVQRTNPVQHEMQMVNPVHFDQPRGNPIQLQLQNVNLAQHGSQGASSVQFEHQRANQAQLQFLGANRVQHQSEKHAQFQLQSLNAAQFQPQSVNHSQLQSVNHSQLQSVNHSQLQTVNHSQLQRVNHSQLELQGANQAQFQYQVTNPKQVYQQRVNSVVKLNPQGMNLVQLELQQSNPVPLEHQGAHHIKLEHQRYEPAQLELGRANPVLLQNQVQTVPHFFPSYYEPFQNEVIQGVHSAQIQDQIPNTNSSSAPSVLAIQCVDCNMVFDNVAQLVKHRLIEKSKLSSHHNSPLNFKLQDLPEGIIGNLSTVLCYDSLDTQAFAN